MNYYNTLLIIVISLFLFTLGCAVLFTEQRWSENYALLDGVQSTSPIMIDGDVKTIGQPSLPAALRSRVQSPEVIITLPDKR